MAKIKDRLSSPLLDSSLSIGGWNPILDRDDMGSYVEMYFGTDLVGKFYLDEDENNLWRAVRDYQEGVRR